LVSRSNVVEIKNTKYFQHQFLKDCNKEEITSAPLLRPQAATEMPYKMKEEDELKNLLRASHKLNVRGKLHAIPCNAQQFQILELN
jgi:hypothetical protein